jgi:sugar phosphate isomerase/epimerase
MATIGLSTYAFFWQLSDRVAAPLSIHTAIERTAELGVDLFQICDYAPLETMSDTGLDAIAATARDAGVELEIGTKGIRPEQLSRCLHIARVLGSRLVRTMFNGTQHRPSIDEAEGLLRAALADFEQAGVRIALETYEQVATSDLMRVVDAIDSPFLGVCSDPANTVAALENPRQVIERVAPRVINMHVKDFAFTRRDGWVGFTLAGAPLGTGLLDYDHMVRTIRPHERGINQIIEHWLPWQGDEATTIRLEREWTANSIDFLRRKQQ